MEGEVGGLELETLVADELGPVVYLLGGGVREFDGFLGLLAQLAEELYGLFGEVVGDVDYEVVQEEEDLHGGGHCQILRIGIVRQPKLTHDRPHQLTVMIDILQSGLLRDNLHLIREIGPQHPIQQHRKKLPLKPHIIKPQNLLLLIPNKRIHKSQNENLGGRIDVGGEGGYLYEGLHSEEGVDGLHEFLVYFWEEEDPAGLVEEYRPALGGHELVGGGERWEGLLALDVVVVVAVVGLAQQVLWSDVVQHTAFTLELSYDIVVETDKLSDFCDTISWKIYGFVSSI